MRSAATRYDEECLFKVQTSQVQPLTAPTAAGKEEAPTSSSIKSKPFSTYHCGRSLAHKLPSLTGITVPFVCGKAEELSSTSRSAEFFGVFTSSDPILDPVGALLYGAGQSRRQDWQ
ncbi:hypothetical protein ABBQ38_011373 [Trebouxia sp. C0009 RCD-2024]